MVGTLVRRIFLALATSIALYVLAALAGALVPGRIAQIADKSTDGSYRTVHLVRGPIHTDLLLPLDAETRAKFAWLRNSGIALDNPGGRWLVFGWGARDFSTATGTYRDVSARAIWRGLTGDSAVMHVSIAGPLGTAANTRPVTLAPAQHARLLDAITRSFARGSDTPPLDLPGFHEWDRFYPATGHFHILNTCNVWIGRVLREARVPFGRWTPLPASVTLSAWLFHPT